jgi:hypothetical protein
MQPGPNILQITARLPASIFTKKTLNFCFFTSKHPGTCADFEVTTEISKSGGVGRRDSSP